jgi:hypothetical protein
MVRGNGDAGPQLSRVRWRIPWSGRVPDSGHALQTRALSRPHIHVKIDHGRGQAPTAALLGWVFGAPWRTMWPVTGPFSVERTGIEPVTSGLQSLESRETIENGRVRRRPRGAWICGFAARPAPMSQSSRRPSTDVLASIWRRSVSADHARKRHPGALRTPTYHGG